MTQSWRNRRLIVLAYYVSLTCVVAVFALSAPDHNWLILLPAALVFLASFARLCAVSKPYYVSGRHWAAPAMLDERQSRVRDHALAWSFWGTSAMFVGLTVWVSAAMTWPLMWQPHNTVQWLLTLWLINTFTSMLPAAIIAWNEPDPVEEHRLEP